MSLSSEMDDIKRCYSESFGAYCQSPAAVYREAAKMISFYSNKIRNSSNRMPREATPGNLPADLLFKNKTIGWSPDRDGTQKLLLASGIIT